MFPRKKHRSTRSGRVKGSASRGRGKKWILIVLVVLLLIPVIQIGVVRFVNPPLTLPMLIDQGSAMFSSAPKRPLLCHWIGLSQIPEMFLEHLWISEDQRFFQHEGFDWKEMELAIRLNRMFNACSSEPDWHYTPAAWRSPQLLRQTYPLH